MIAVKSEKDPWVGRLLNMSTLFDVIWKISPI